MKMYNSIFLFKWTAATVKFQRPLFNKLTREIVQSRSVTSVTSYTKTEVTIPVPITGGHLAAQVWEGTRCLKSLPSSYPTPIIFMHGYQDNSSSFDPLIPLIIRDNMTILAVDLPGHGLSSHMTGIAPDFLLDGLATIHRAINHFGWNKVTLIGHSFGSVLSFVFASTNVDKVHKYVAIDNLSPVRRDPVKNVNVIIKKLFEVEAKLVDPKTTQPSYTYEDILRRTMKARNGTVTEDGVKTLLERGAVSDCNDPNLFKFSHDFKTNIPSIYGRYSSDAISSFTANIRCPVCVIKGEPGDDFEPRENFMKVVDDIKTANGGKLEFHLVPGTHHFHLNDPFAVAPIISKFLNADFDK